MRSFGQIKRLKRRGKLTRNYYVRVYEPMTGRQQWITTHCSSLRAAKAWVSAQELAEATGVTARPTKKDRTFAEVYREWFESKEGVVSTSYVSELKSCGTFWIPYFGDRPIGEIESAEIRAYLKKRKVGTVPGAKTLRVVSAATINNDLRNLKSLFNFALNEDYIDRTPCRGIRRFSGVRARKAHALSPEDEQKLLQACLEPYAVVVTAKRNAGGRHGGKSTHSSSTFTQTGRPPDYLHTLVYLALYCGFRRRTLVSVRWCDVDLKRKRWNIPGEFMKRAADYRAPVPASVVEVLLQYRKALGKLDDAVTRLSQDSTILGLCASSVVSRSFQAAVKRAGLTGFKLHDCRRVFLNRLRQQGVSLEAAMALSAHKSVETVLGYYRQVTDSELDDAVHVLDALARDSKPQTEEAG